MQEDRVRGGAEWTVHLTYNEGDLVVGSGQGEAGRIGARTADICNGERGAARRMSMGKAKG